MNNQPVASTDILDNEEYVRKLINEQQEWESTYGIDLQHHFDNINRLLSENSPSSLNRLYEYIKEKTIVRNYQSVPEIAYIIVLSTIYKSEITADECCCIYQGITSIDTAIQRFNELKFLFINIEWDFDQQEALDTIIHYMNTKAISLTALTYFIQISNINKALVCDILINAFMQHGMISEAAQMTVNKKRINTNN